jgi:hypothetical protein
VRLVIILFLLLALFLLAAAGLTMFADQVDKLSIWNIQGLRAFKTPLIVAAVATGVALLLVLNARSTKKAEMAQHEFALSRGWAYSESNNDSQGVVEKIGAFLKKVFPEKDFDVTSVVTVNPGKETIFLFDCWYRSGGSGRKTSVGSACLIQSDSFRLDAGVDIVPRDSIAGMLLSNQVEMGEREFARHFIVQSKEPGTARKSVTGLMQAALVDQKNALSLGFGRFDVYLGPGTVVVLRWSRASPEDWPAMVDMARRIESAME